MSIKILEPSLFSSLQDLGRKNYANFGIARSGALDTYSLLLANILLGNYKGEAGLELCLSGGSYEFLQEHYFCLAGADFCAKLNSKDIKSFKVYRAKKGDVLELGRAKFGFRGYLCVAGGFDCEAFLGSKSSDFKMGVGLFCGRAMQKGDILECKNSFKPFNLEKRECENPYENLAQTLEIRVLIGTDKDAFTEKSLEIFFNEKFKISPNSDRMAIRTHCAKSLEHKTKADIISDPAVFGNIQVPKDGLPIILMAGRQSTGGYTKIATVIENDLSLLAQARLGSFIKFKELDINEALRVYKERMKSLKKLDERINLNFERLF